MGRWIGWVEKSDKVAWSAKCKYCDYALSILRGEVRGHTPAEVRALMLRLRNVMIDHLALRHLDQPMREEGR